MTSRRFLGQIAAAALLFTSHTLLAAPHALIVINGSGSGTYEAGEVVRIWANPYDDTDLGRTVAEPDSFAEQLRVFDQWVGDTSTLVDGLAAETTLVMPDDDLTVTAQYKDGQRFGVPRAISYFPPGHDGVVFFFHGGGQNCGAVCLMDKPQMMRFFDDVAARGLGLVLVEGYDFRNQEWDAGTTLGTNFDLQRVVSVYRRLVATGQIGESEPIYLAGVSGGGQFASLFGNIQTIRGALPVNAMALYISAGDSAVMANTTIPTIWLIGENDETPGVNSGSFTNYANLLGRGVPAQYWLQPPTAVYRELFWRIEGLAQTDSQSIYNALKANGFLNGKDLLLTDPQSSGWEAVIPAGITVLFEPKIADLLTVAWSGHALTSAFNNKVLDFFENPTTIVNGAPQISGFSPPANHLGLPVTISGEDFLGTVQVRFNGVPATITTALSDQLFVLVPEAATTGPIEVSNEVGTATSAADFVVYAVPQISGFLPTTGPVGTEVTISGTDFTGAIAVRFSAAPAAFTVQDNDTITATVPAGAGLFPLISVSTPSGTDLADEPFVIQ